jgi:hypothetical protein
MVAASSEAEVVGLHCIRRQAAAAGFYSGAARSEREKREIKEKAVQLGRETELGPIQPKMETR